MKFGIIFIYITTIVFGLSESKAFNDGHGTRRTTLASSKGCPVGYQEFGRICLEKVKPRGSDNFGRETFYGSKERPHNQEYQIGARTFGAQNHDSSGRAIFNMSNVCPAGYQSFHGNCMKIFTGRFHHY